MTWDELPPAHRTIVIDVLESAREAAHMNWLRTNRMYATAADAAQTARDALDAAIAKLEVPR